MALKTCSLLGLVLVSPLAAENRHASAYVQAIEKINAAHAKRPGDTLEDSLVETIPRPAVVSLARMLKEEPSDDIASDPKHRKMLEHLRDARWRSLALERKRLGEDAAPSTRNRDGVMALLIKLHDTAGPKAIGAALNLMDEKNAGHRINHVRYYSFDDLQKALAAVLDDPETRRTVRDLFRPPP